MKARIETRYVTERDSRGIALPIGWYAELWSADGAVMIEGPYDSADAARDAMRAQLPSDMEVSCVS
jgi:hypothetical protein